jgi:hypothetical protein
MGNPSITLESTDDKRPLLSLSKNELPLTVEYGDKAYVLVLTRSGKLLLQKPQ